MDRAPPEQTEEEQERETCHGLLPRTDCGLNVRFTGVLCDLRTRLGKEIQYLDQIPFLSLLLLAIDLNDC